MEWLQGFIEYAFIRILKYQLKLTEFTSPEQIASV